jgi:hypothetical protein
MYNPRRLADAEAIFSTIELKDNTIIVVLGASGDLAKKKTVSHTCLYRVAFITDTPCDSSPLCSALYVPSRYPRSNSATSNGY